jgi:broad specificity phosphatase PhoE
MNYEKQLTVKIPAEMQPKLDNREYTIDGTQVRDKLGRFVCNLESLETPDHLYFSPQIFVSFEQYCFISINAVSNRLKLDLESNKSQLSSLENKIDTILERQTGNLIALISDFNEHFASLGEKSKLTDEKSAFSSGVKAATAIAANFGSYLNEYLDSTDVRFGPSMTETTFGQYRKEKHGTWDAIKDSKFGRFQKFDINYLAYSLLNILNNLNLLSITYDSRIHPRYEESLQEIERQLTDVLTRLVNGFGDGQDIFSMMFATATKENSNEIDVKRILRFDSSYSLNDLIIRSYPRGTNIKRDVDRFKSIGDILDLLEEIENLRNRASSLSSIQLASSPDVAALKTTLFGSNDA